MFLFSLIYLKKLFNNDQSNAGGLSSHSLVSLNEDDLVSLFPVKFVAILSYVFVCKGCYRGTYFRRQDSRYNSLYSSIFYEQLGIVSVFVYKCVCAFCEF